jgi:metal-sulfur cluster biosynthetic enzyme
MASQLLAEVREKVRALGFKSVEVTLARESVWQPSRMTPAARQALGWR